MIEAIESGHAMKQQLHNQMTPTTLRTAEIDDFNLDKESCRLLGCGSFGSSFAVTVKDDAARLQQMPEAMARKGIALKMMHNHFTGDGKSKAQRTRFEVEYRAGLQFPHWTLANIHNYFRSFTAPSLLELAAPKAFPNGFVLINSETDRRLPGGSMNEDAIG